MANEDMIQTHVDNFLAKIAGETPIDDNPRNSTEFWLNEIAENMPSGGGGALYTHFIKLTLTGLNQFTLLLYSTDNTPISTGDAFISLMRKMGLTDNNSAFLPTTMANVQTIDGVSAMPLNVSVYADPSVNVRLTYRKLSDNSNAVKNATIASISDIVGSFE